MINNGGVVWTKGREKSSVGGHTFPFVWAGPFLPCFGELYDEIRSSSSDQVGDWMKWREIE